MKIYISTANQYIHLLKPFAYLFNKFWDNKQEVVILGYEEPTFELPINFKFVSLGKQVGGIKMWSTDLRKFFESIDDEFFIYTVEDHFIVHPVNFNVINKFYDLLDSDVGRIGLTNDNKGRPFDLYDKGNDFDIIINRDDANYRLSLLWCIWNKKYLLKYLKDGIDPHEFEISGSRKSIGDGYKILSSFGEYAIHQNQAVRKGDVLAPIKFNFINDKRVLDQTIINDMIKKELI